MDALAGLLDGPRARGAFLMRSVLVRPWSLRIQDEAPLTLMAVMRTHAWVMPHAGEALRLNAGDVALVRGPDPYTVADDPATPPRVIVHPGQRCTTPEGVSLSEAMDLGPRTWGDRNGRQDGEESQEGQDGQDDSDGSGGSGGSGGSEEAAVLLTGTYQMTGEVTGHLLRALPTLVVVPADAWDGLLLKLLDTEICQDRPGQEVYLDRLLDLLLITVLRVWFSRWAGAAPAWYRAQSDPVVGRALRLIHDDPARAWTVAGLAAEAGASRAALSRRFTALVGEPPMAYLTGLRIALAADLLREPDATIGAVARQVGYGSPFSLSAAFKRVRGVSPREHRDGSG